ncbi:unnamed protein product [Sympodiomycopsis kandeliae]
MQSTMMFKSIPSIRRKSILSFSLLLFTLICLPLTCLAQDYYKLLDIDRSSDAKTIKKAYRRLAQRLHPDKYPEKEAEFVKMSEAYQVLSDDELRKIYDRYGQEGVKRHQQQKNGPGGGGGGHDPFDIFRNFFGGGGGGGAGGGPQVRKGPSKQFNLLLPLKELYTGKTVNLEFERSVLCTKCDGSGARSKEDIHQCGACGGRGVRIVVQEIMPGFRTQMQAVCNECGGQGLLVAHKCAKCNGDKVITEHAELAVDIEPGASEGETYIFEGESDEGPEPDIEAGDVIVTVSSDSARNSGGFRRRGSHLYLSKHLSLPDALLGFEKTFKHMDGHEFTIRRTGVTQNGMVITVPNQGMPIKGNDSGNLYVEYEIVLPDKVEGDFKEVLEKVFNRKAVRDEDHTQRHEEL